MKRRNYPWKLTTADGTVLASGIKYAHNSGLDAAVAALRERCRAGGFYADYISCDKQDDHTTQTWWGDGQAFLATVERPT